MHDASCHMLKPETMLVSFYDMKAECSQVVSMHRDIGYGTLALDRAIGDQNG